MRQRFTFIVENSILLMMGLSYFATAPDTLTERSLSMTCKEAEQMVMPYINKELTDKELSAFLSHIRICRDCYEELETYYTIYTGLAQLEDGGKDQNIHRLLEESLRVSELQIRGRKFFQVYYVLSQVLAMAALTAIMVMEFLSI